MDVVIVTANGNVKRTAVDQYRQQGRGGSGIAAIGVAPGDRVVGAVKLAMEQSVMVVTASGTAIRFAASELRAMGRGAQGVRGIRLKDGDKVVAVVAL
jgi:DNA gyrase subunit A